MGAQLENDPEILAWQHIFNLYDADGDYSGITHSTPVGIRYVMRDRSICALHPGW